MANQASIELDLMLLLSLAMEHAFLDTKVLVPAAATSIQPEHRSSNLHHFYGQFHHCKSTRINKFQLEEHFPNFFLIICLVCLQRSCFHP